MLLFVHVYDLINIFQKVCKDGCKQFHFVSLISLRRTLVYTTLGAIVYHRLSVGQQLSVWCVYHNIDIHLYNICTCVCMARYCDPGGHRGRDLTARDC